MVCLRSQAIKSNFKGRISYIEVLVRWFLPENLKVSENSSYRTEPRPIFKCK